MEKMLLPSVKVCDLYSCHLDLRIFMFFLFLFLFLFFFIFFIVHCSVLLVFLLKKTWKEC